MKMTLLTWEIWMKYSGIVIGCFWKLYLKFHYKMCNLQKKKTWLFYSRCISFFVECIATQGQREPNTTHEKLQWPTQHNNESLSFNTINNHMYMDHNKLMYEKKWNVTCGEARIVKMARFRIPDNPANSICRIPDRIQLLNSTIFTN